MTPLPPTPSGVVRIHLLHTLGAISGVGCKTDMSYSGGSPSTAQLSALAAAVSSAWSTNLAGLLASGYALSEVQCVDLATPSTAAGVNTATENGTRSGALFPINISAVVERVISRRYRGSRPKVFTPYGTDSDFGTGQHWSSSFEIGLQDAWANFEAALIGLTVGSGTIAASVAVSYYHGSTVVTSPTTGRARNVPTPRATPLVSPVVAFKTSPTFGSQRRRLTQL